MSAKLKDSAEKQINKKKSNVKHCTNCGIKLTEQNSKEYNLKTAKYIYVTLA